MSSSAEVLVVPHGSVQHLYQAPGFFSSLESIRQVLDAIAENGRFVDRQWAEQHPSVKQIVAYGVVRHERLVLCLRRSAGSSRESLRLRYTLLMGGHVDGTERSSETPLEGCLLRELEEELGITPSRHPLLLGIAADPSTSVGLLHLGLIYDVPIESVIVHVPSTRDNSEFINASTHNTYRLEPVDSFLGRPFDSWSSLFLASDACERLLGWSHPSRKQRRLPLDWACEMLDY